MAKKLRPGKARVEFLACMTEIFDLIEKGHSSTYVHEVMIEKKKISMSYSSLIKFLKKKKENKEVKYLKPTNSKQITAIEADKAKKASQSQIGEDVKCKEKPSTKEIALIAIASTAMTPQIKSIEGSGSSEGNGNENSSSDGSEDGKKVKFENLEVDTDKLF